METFEFFGLHIGIYAFGFLHHSQASIGNLAFGGTGNHWSGWRQCHFPKGASPADGEIGDPLGQGKRLLDRFGLVALQPNLGIDSHERGVGREEVVGEAEVGDFLDPFVARVQCVVVAEKCDPVTGPEVSEGGMVGKGLDRCHIDRLPAGLPSARSFEFNDPLRIPPPFSEYDHGPLGQNVRNTFGFHVVGLKAAKVDLDSREYG